jgi:DNA-directed RNA polymerase omega subunit
MTTTETFVWFFQFKNYILTLFKHLCYNNTLQGETMTVRIESRSSEIDTERCVEHAGGRYDLVIAAAQRLREMKRRARETNDFVTPIDALKEVQSGTFSMLDYLAKVK